ncbi:polyphosphate:AMP phosphotransferase [Motiliproteus sp. SC1-56]|uniref:polyphosphate:AMP phosphotransferase n=1 Tax=Motiliproteus sp. SC1-56 TaxID=2799565 RepID=UPI001A8C3D27|nr:polyphosphate:AMP phosphotransferase [Motiliproteus sp. SC1-56]
MFETAELGRTLAPDEYKQRVPRLREELLAAQRELRAARRFPVIVLFAGVDGAGKGEICNLLNEWTDPRWLVTNAYGPPSQEERERPTYWRYWRDLPPKGQIGLFLSAWYSRPILARVYGETGLAQFDEELNRIMNMEQALADDGALILKFWLHLDKQSQQTRFKTLEQDPLNSWQVTDRDWKHWRLYDAFIATAEHCIRRTSTGDAPWSLIEGTDIRYSATAVATRIRDAIVRHLQTFERRKTDLAAPPLPAKKGTSGNNGENGKALRKRARKVDRPDFPTVLSALDSNLRLDKERYRNDLKRLHKEVNQLYREAERQGIASVLVFEGWDAAGKGGAIRRLTRALEARLYKVIPIAAPTDEERAHHYLWRFWRHLPRAGHLSIFDRSWYGRVLVERVEGFSRQSDWMRAYHEINDFEEQLVERGLILVKYWLDITPEEQLARFDARAETPHKRWKLTDEDWRNREKWADYERAVHDMVERTSSHVAPWTLVEANNKRYARIKVLETFRDQLKARLDQQQSAPRAALASAEAETATAPTDSD